MDYRLRGKTAFVTGSTSGIGYAIAKLLAQEGVTVTINGRSEETVTKAVKQLGADVPGSKVEGAAIDFARKDDVTRALSTLKATDILVNNVGIYTSQTFQETSDEDWYRMFEVNVMSGVRISRAFLPSMLSKGWGRIVFISSECAQMVPADLLAYSATKAALHAVSRGLAQLTRGTAVTVNTVMPGSTLSEGAKDFLQGQASRTGISKEEAGAEFFRRERPTSLLGRFATTEEVAHAVVYLCSPIASATNGAVVKADGGSVTGIF